MVWRLLVCYRNLLVVTSPGGHQAGSTNIYAAEMCSNLDPLRIVGGSCEPMYR